MRAGPVALKLIITFSMLARTNKAVDPPLPSTGAVVLARLSATRAIAIGTAPEPRICRISPQISGFAGPRSST
jgi:hypothetical protein